MAHARYEDLSDLEPILEAVRTWEGLCERKPGTFYFKRKGFLHFHTKGERRWADVRHGTDWGEPLEIPTTASERARAAFQRALRKAYEATRDA